jgi:hypothetical protein
MSFNLKAQTSFTALTHIKTTADFFTSDNQANVYVAKGNELFKYNKQGKLLYKYSTKKYSNISFVDAGNLLRILLFYKDFLLVEFLDNTLSLNSDALSLEQIGYYQTQLVCTSNNSGTWLFDMQNFELIRLSKTLEITNRSGNLSSILNIDFLPTYLIENDNRVFLNNPKTGILVFDIYGTYFKTIPYQNVQSFQVVSDWVYIKTEKNILAYNIITSEEKTFDIPISDFKKFRIENNYLLLQLTDEIIIYEEK